MPCPAGKASPTSGSASCIDCVAGHFADTRSSSCSKCGASTYSVRGSSECTSCPANSWSLAGATSKGACRPVRPLAFDATLVLDRRCLGATPAEDLIPIQAFIAVYLE